MPYELEQKFNDGLITDRTRRYIFTINNSEKRLVDVNYEIQIIYEDRLKNKYSINLKGVRENCKLDLPKLLE